MPKGYALYFDIKTNDKKPKEMLRNGHFDYFFDIIYMVKID